MSTITLQVPDKVELDARETVRFLAAKLYETGRLSLGQAAELADLSKVVFLEMLGDYESLPLRNSYHKNALRK